MFSLTMISKRFAVFGMRLHIIILRKDKAFIDQIMQCSTLIDFLMSIEDIYPHADIKIKVLKFNKDTHAMSLKITDKKLKVTFRVELESVELSRASSAEIESKCNKLRDSIML